MKLTDLVNVFHGNSNVDAPAPQGVAKAWHPIKPLTGNTHPGATLPFGKYSVCAYSGGYVTGYGINKANSTANPIEVQADAMRIQGFSHFQNSGTGAISIYYNYAVVKPFVGAPATDYGMAEETARPGYYGVTLTETGIKCAFTVSPYAVYHRYTFPTEGGGIQVDFTNDGLYETDSGWLRGTAQDVAIRVVDDRHLCATSTLQGVKLYFALSFEGEGALDENGVFRLSKAGTVVLRMSISSAGEENACKGLSLAISDFETVKNEADKQWEEALSRLEIPCDDRKEAELFYSNLYQTIVKPNDWGQDSFLWKDGNMVVDFSTLWDMYKTQLPFVFTLYPAISEHIVETLAQLGKVWGHFPNAFMISTRRNICLDQAKMLSHYVFYDAWRRGIKADWNAVYRLMLADLENDEEFRQFCQTGKGECASHTLDMAGGCYLMVDMGKALGFTEEAKEFRNYVNHWKNVYDENGLLKNEGRFYEGNYWTYSFRPLPNAEERVALCGKEQYIALLDQFFGYTHPEDFTGRFEGFNNECDMEVPYAYHIAGEMGKLCDILDKADAYIYRDKQGGAGRGAIPGNNDSGGMSSCYLWNCIGAFPVAGQNVFLLSRPKFASLILHLSNGKSLTVRRVGNGNVPAKVTFNGEICTDFRLSVTEFMQGGNLIFEME